MLNTQHYKVCIKGKVEQSRERKKHPRRQFGVIAIEKGAFKSPSTTVANFTTYKAKLVYKTTNETSDVCNRKRNRAKKILWFTPSYNMAVANKLGKQFFEFLKNFPLSSNLYKIFNRNTIKLSYSCMPNVPNLINKSNIKKLGNKQTIEPCCIVKVNDT